MPSDSGSGVVGRVAFVVWLALTSDCLRGRAWLSGPSRGSVNYPVFLNKFLHELVRVEMLVCN